jgi:hypothetical protein
MIASEIGCQLAARVGTSSSGTSSMVAFLIVVLGLSSIVRVSASSDTSSLPISIALKGFVLKGVPFMSLSFKVSIFFRDAKIFRRSTSLRHGRSLSVPSFQLMIGLFFLNQVRPRMTLSFPNPAIKNDVGSSFPLILRLTMALCVTTPCSFRVPSVFLVIQGFLSLMSGMLWSFTNSESMNSLEAPQSKRARVSTVCSFVPIATGKFIDWGVMSATSTEEIIKAESLDVAPSLLIKNPLSPSGRQFHLFLLHLICP